MTHDPKSAARPQDLSEQKALMSAPSEPTAWVRLEDIEGPFSKLVQKE